MVAGSSPASRTHSKQLLWAPALNWAHLGRRGSFLNSVCIYGCMHVYIFREREKEEESEKQLGTRPATQAGALARYPTGDLSEPHQPGTSV